MSSDKSIESDPIDPLGPLSLALCEADKGKNMAKQFYIRLKNYFENVGEVLRGEADAGSIFPNTTDIGLSRELVYAEFLKQHAPSKW